MKDVAAKANRPVADRLVPGGYFPDATRTVPGPSGKLGRQESDWQRSYTVFDFAAKQICVADELRGVSSRRAGINFAGRGHLLQFTHAQQCDAVRHDHGFFLIMGHEHESDSDFALQ